MKKGILARWKKSRYLKSDDEVALIEARDNFTLRGTYTPFHSQASSNIELDSEQNVPDKMVQLDDAHTVSRSSSWTKLK